MHFEINMPKPVKLALDQLCNSGFETYIVGGCVRDALLHKTPSDWDITTAALPDQICQTFQEYSCLDIGRKHGTITVLIDGIPLEITTFRTEGNYLDHRHPESIAFTTSLTEDLSRRDFTINALAYHPKTGIIDPFHGVEDLRNKQIRAVGTPTQRFTEDGLRILRGLRFAAQLGFTLEKHTEAALVQTAPLLKAISAERIQEEFNKIVCAENASAILRKYAAIFFSFLPEIEPMINFAQNNPYHCFDIWEHSLHALENTPNHLILRLAALFHDCGKPRVYTQDEKGIGHFYHHEKVSAEITSRILTRLRYDTKTWKQVTTLIQHHGLVWQAEKKWVKRQLNRLGEETFFQLADLHRSDTLAQSALAQYRLKILSQCVNIAREIMAEKDCFQLSQLTVNGKDLIALGIPPGKMIGSCLSHLLSAVIDETCPNQKENLLLLAKKWYQSKIN